MFLSLMNGNNEDIDDFVKRSKIFMFKKFNICNNKQTAECDETTRLFFFFLKKKLEWNIRVK